MTRKSYPIINDIKFKKFLNGLVGDDLLVESSAFEGRNLILEEGVGIDVTFIKNVCSKKSVNECLDLFQDEQALIFYYRSHDNLVKELSFLDCYNKGKYLNMLNIFFDFPAKEGGSSVLGCANLMKNGVFILYYDPCGDLSVDYYSKVEG